VWRRATRDRGAVFVLKENSVTQHPSLHLVDVRCSSCGAIFAVRSTAETISIDVCSNCHPAYTGRERTAVTGGRIERFNRRRTLAAA
jgi:large subunit ribosomal protein L31